MRKFKNFLGLVLVCSFGLLSCEKDETNEKPPDFFHVKISNTELPVWIKGNTKNRKLILYVNGGPGLTSIDVASADMFGWSKILEDEFAMVYYDQRGCGNSQGNILETSLTVDQFTLDLEAIITVLISQYPGYQIYLMGHSFGSFIGANYLMDSARQSKISGWISVDGAFNFDYSLQWEYRRDFLTNIAHEEVAKGNNPGHWNEALAWAVSNPAISTDEQKDKWRDFIGDPGERIIPLEEGKLSFRQYMSIGFFSSYNPFPAYLSKNLEIVNDKLNKDAEGKNLISGLVGISLPTLFIWGRYDDLIPPELGQDAFMNLGTPDHLKKFFIMQESSHEPYISDPETFQNAIINFVR